MLRLQGGDGVLQFAATDGQGHRILDFVQQSEQSGAAEVIDAFGNVADVGAFEYPEQQGFLGKMRVAPVIWTA